jgi:hypothetical protein
MGIASLASIQNYQRAGRLTVGDSRQLSPTSGKRDERRIGLQGFGRAERERIGPRFVIVKAMERSFAEGSQS